MKDRGKVTIFLCLITTGMVMLGMVCTRIVSIYCAKGKTAIVSGISMSDVKANYNSYIFEHYHILLFDKNCYGCGEGAIEERMEELTKSNLDDKYSVQGVYITNYKMIYDNECEELKKQIEENSNYEILTYGIDQIQEKLNNREGSYSDILEEDMNAACEESLNETESVEEGQADGYDGINQGDKVEDPREYTKTTDAEGLLLTLLLPPDREVSREKIAYEDFVSVFGVYKPDFMNTNIEFDDYNRLKQDMKNHSTWGNSLVEKANTLMYSGTVFNCFTENNINSDSVLECEIEYIISAKDSDYANLEEACKKIIAIRLPMNMSYIVTDTAKMSTIRSISVPLSAASLFLSEPVIRYLIAGAWSYIEAMAEVRNLLAGNRLDFVKTKDTWLTDITDIGSSLENEQDSEKGLSYKDYLMILLAMEDDNIYYRMLDIMDINTRKHQPEFKMLFGATELEADFDILFQGRDVSVHQKFSYIQ